MSHTRGQIVKSIDFTGQYFYKVYTGCEHLDDYYTVDSEAHAEQISREMQQYYFGTMERMPSSGGNVK